MPIDFVIMIILMIAVFYFLIIRPQRKRMSQHQDMQAQLAPGTRVLLSSGMFGTVVHVGERQVVVELAPGTEITVLKGNIARPVNPDEEEFEFDDAPAAAVADELPDEPAAITDEQLEQLFGSQPAAEEPANDLAEESADDLAAAQDDETGTEDPK